MKHLLPIMILIPTMATAQVGDAVMITQLQTLIGLATAEQANSWQSAQSQIMQVYHLANMAMDSYRSIQNQVKSLDYQLQSMKERFSAGTDIFSKIDTMLGGLDQIRTQLNTVNYTITGNRTIPGSSILPSSKRLNEVKSAISRIENLKSYPGESPSAYAIRFKTEVANLKSLWTDSERVEKQASEDMVALAVRSQSVRATSAEVIRQLEKESTVNNKSTIAQLQIISDYLAQSLSIQTEMYSLLSAQALQSAATQERLNRNEIVADAIATQSTKITTPDTAQLERQIQSSGISVNDLTGGSSTPNGGFDFNKRY